MKTTAQRRQLLQWCAALPLWQAARGARADVLDAPECIVPAKVGGGFDLTCKLVERLVAQKPGRGKPLAIRYLPGGIGAVAFDRMVTGQLPNPNALVAFSSGSLLNLVQGKFGPHKVDDVRWLAAVGTDYGAIAVPADSPIRSLPDLVVQLQRGLGRVVFGAGGTVGSQDWVKAALLVKGAGQDHKSMRFVSFEGGGEALSALEGKHVSVFCGDAAEALQAFDAGTKIRLIAILSDARLPGKHAGIPTAREQGIPLVWPVIRGVYVGHQVSDDVFRQWSEFFQARLAAPEFPRLQAHYGLYAAPMTGKALADFVHAQVQSYARLAAELGLRVHI